MRYNTIRFENYDWNVYVLSDVTHDDTEEVLSWLDFIGSWNKRDGSILGVTYSNLKNGETLIVIGRTDDASELMNTACHENMHAAMHITEALGLDAFGEAPCYIAGKLMGEETETLLQLL